MLLDADFVVDGRSVRPFARADWIGELDDDSVPGHLRMLGAEFVAVPFGSSGAPANLATEWSWLVSENPPARPHGPSADDEWIVVGQGEDWVTFALDYPEPYAVSRLERTVRLRADSASIDFELTVTARRAGRTAIGLHPILRLPDEAGDLELRAEFATGFTYPGSIWPGAGVTAPARTFDSLGEVPGAAQESVDLSRLPLPHECEDVLLLAGVSEPVTAVYHDDLSTVRIDWDRGILPSLLLWISDRALQEEPWGGRYRGLGVEPIAAAFDFDDAVSVASNPVSLAGYPTSVELSPTTPVVIRYSIEVGSLEP